MSAKRIVPAVIAGIMLIAGCATEVLPEADVVVDGVPSGECIMHPTPGPGPFLLCPMAVELAAAKLAVLPGRVSTVEFHLGVLCPPNARCVPLTDRGTVVFWFMDGPPVMVPIAHVAQVGFVAGEPQAAPQWLVDQGPGAGLPAN